MIWSISIKIELDEQNNYCFGYFLLFFTILHRYDIYHYFIHFIKNTFLLCLNCCAFEFDTFLGDRFCLQFQIFLALLNRNNTTILFLFLSTHLVIARYFDLVLLTFFNCFHHCHCQLIDNISNSFLLCNSHITYLDFTWSQIFMN